MVVPKSSKDFPKRNVKAIPSKIKIILYAVFTGLVFSLNYGVVEDEVFEAAEPPLHTAEKIADIQQKSIRF